MLDHRLQIGARRREMPVRYSQLVHRCDDVDQILHLQAGALREMVNALQVQRKEFYRLRLIRGPTVGNASQPVDAFKARSGKKQSWQQMEYPVRVSVGI